MTDHELLLAIYNDLQTVKNKVEIIENNISQVDTRVTKIETTLENETNKNIMIIAENLKGLCL